MAVDAQKRQAARELLQVCVVHHISGALANLSCRPWANRERGIPSGMKDVPDNGKPAVTPGRKASGPSVFGG